jgi:putative ABC transport system permease protein
MIVQIAWKNIWHKPLGFFLSWLLITLSVAMIWALLAVQQQFEKQFSANIDGIDMVIGAKGSPLQLILSAVYQIDAPTGNIAQKDVERWMRHPFVETAIPLAYGDSYKGVPLLGTVPGYIDKYKGKLDSGRLFQQNFEVVAGSRAAQKLGLRVGSRFYSTHGSDEHGEEHDAHPYTVTGILQPTGSVLDNLLVGNIESVWQMHEKGDEDEGPVDADAMAAARTPKHDHGGHRNANKVDTAADHHDDDADHPKGANGPTPTDHGHAKSDTAAADKAITAVLIQFRTPMGAVQLPRAINEQSTLMAAVPAIEVNRLFTLFESGADLLQKLGGIIMLVACLSVFISLYRSLEERKPELALMRTMGAGKNQLFLLLLTEGLLIGIAGVAAGLLLGRLGLWLARGHLSNSYHVSLSTGLRPQEGELWLVAISLGLVAAAALLPAVKARFINISKTLSNA